MQINLPSTIFSHIEINKDNFIVKLEVSDTLDSQGVGTWFNNDNIGDMLELVVIRAETEEMRRVLSCASTSPTLADPNLPSNRADVILWYHLLTSGQGASPSKRMELLDRVRKNTYVRKTSLNHDFVGSREQIIDSELEDGKTKVYYDFNFPLSRLDNDILDGTKPGDLDVSVFAFIKVNTDRIQEEMNFSFREGEYYHGNAVSEKIISNNEFQNTSFIYRTADNNIFHGTVEDDGSGEYRGLLDGQRVVLTKETIKNYKIMNNRDKTSLKSFKMGFNHTPYKIVKSSRVTNDSMFNGQNPAYFSDLHHTKNRFDNVLAMFSINKSELLERNTLFGPLLSSMSNLKKQEMVEKCRIKNLTIKRVRVTDQSERVTGINTTKNQYVKLDKNEPDTLLLSIGETEQGVFPEVNNDKVFFTEENMFVSNPSYGIKSYSFEDKEFKDITDGMYQYEIEVEITDPLINFLSEKLDSYNLEVSKLSQYYHFASSDKTYYNPNKKRFASKFGTIVRDEFNNDPEQFPWITAPAKYIDTLTEFAPRVSSTLKNKFLQGVSNIISPDTGNPDEINILLKLMEAAAGRLKEMSGLSKKPSISHTGGSQTQSSNQSSKKSGVKTHKESYRFSTIVNSESKKQFGYEYIAFGGTQTGIKRLNDEEYTARVEDETLKFFQTAEEKITFKARMLSRGTVGGVMRTIGRNRNFHFSLEDKKYSFLTPQSFINGSQNLPIPLENKDKYKDLQSLVSTNGEVGTVSARAEFTSTLFSVSVEKEGVEDSSQDRIEENHTQREVTGTENKINNFFETMERTLNGTVSPFIDSVSNEEIGNNVEIARKLPNQVKAILLNDGENNSNIQSDILTDMQAKYTSYGSVLYQLFYGQLVRVEYLSGFTKNSEGKTMINSPVWKELDGTTISSVAGQDILCRLRYYQSEDILFPIERNELFDINVYDSLFFVSISPAAALAPDDDDDTGTTDSDSFFGSAFGKGPGTPLFGTGDDGPTGDTGDTTGDTGDTTGDTGTSGGQGTTSAESKNRCILLDIERSSVGAAFQAAQSNVVINQDPTIDPSEIGND